MSEVKTKRTTIDFPVRAVMVTDEGELSYSKTFLMAVRKGGQKPQGQFVVEVLSASTEDYLLKASNDVLRYHLRSFLESLEPYMFVRDSRVFLVLEPIEEVPLPSVDELLYS